MARPKVREQILDAAQRLLHREGVGALTTRQIAVETGATEASVFNNFGDKEGLCQALIRERLSALAELQKAIADDEVEVAPWLEEIYLRARQYYLQVLPLTSPFWQRRRIPEKIPPQLESAPHSALVDALTKRWGIGRRRGKSAVLATALLGAALHTAVEELSARPARPAVAAALGAESAPVPRREGDDRADPNNENNSSEDRNREEARQIAYLLLNGVVGR